MTIYNLLITIFWIIIAAIWLLSAFTAKRSASKNASFYIVRLAFFIVIILYFRTNPFQGFSFQHNAVAMHPLLDLLGTVICAVGIAFAIWARFYLGRNWGMPMSIKAQPELVTTGPYAYVRNPIYSGILFAIIGTILAGNYYWWIALVVCGAYFIYSATVEQKNMTRLFPGTYPAYKKRTKMLIPFML